MHTYLLSDEDVRRYAVDLADRLAGMGSNVPRHWFSLGNSGDKMLEALRPFLPTRFEDQILVTRVGFSRKKKKIVERDKDGVPRSLGGKSAFIIDSAVHSGASMRHLADELTRLGAKNIWSYSLVLKRMSEFVPSFFGILIDEHDRAFFQLDQIPNNRLHSAKALIKKGPFGVLRALREEDVSRRPDHLRAGVKSIDKMTYADLYYGVKTQDAQVFVYEIAGEVCGFITFLRSNGTLFVDTIAIDKTRQALGIGGLLMRWAESYARSTRCGAIELWAIENRRGFYKALGYEVVRNETMDLGAGEKYQKMRRRMLYNVKPSELADLNH